MQSSRLGGRPSLRIGHLVVAALLVAGSACGARVPHGGQSAQGEGSSNTPAAWNPTQHPAGTAADGGTTSPPEQLPAIGSGSRPLPRQASSREAAAPSAMPPPAEGALTNNGTGPSVSKAERAVPAGAETRSGLAEPNSPCPEKKSTIAIASVGQQSGPAGQPVNGTVAVQAWTRSMNARGGLNCHPLKYIVVDDYGDPSRHQAEVQRLVERDGVLAFVYNDGTMTWQASERYITERRVPVVGTETGEAAVYTNPMYFPQMSSAELIFEATIAAADVMLKPQGYSSFAVMTCVEVPLCSAVYDAAPAYAAKYGFTLAYRGKASIIQPDYTSHCQRAKDAKADLLYAALDANSIIRLIRSCERINYHPKVVMTSTTTGTIPPPELNGALVSFTAVPWFVTSNPGVEEFRATLQRFAPGVVPSAVTMQAWVAAKLFERATQGLPDPPTREGVLEGLWSIYSDDLGGLTLPLTFQRNQPAERRLCYWLIEVKGSDFASPNNGRRICH